MEQSPEIRDLMLRLYQNMMTGDLSFLERFIAQRSDVISIGTDPSEWWVGYGVIVRIARAQYQEMGGESMPEMKVLHADPQAFREGTVGWAADNPTFELPDGIQVSPRMTAVFHQEDGEWKLVLQHTSAGVANEDLVGKHLTLE